MSCGIFAPLVSIVGGYGLAIIGKGKVYLKKPMTELIIKQKGFVGVCISFVEDATESVGDVSMVFRPGIVEIIGRLSSDRGRSGRIDVGAGWF